MTPTSVVRRGPIYWWESYVAMLRFDFARHRAMLVTALASQLFMGFGLVIMYGLYLGSVDSATGLYLTSGVPALSLIPVGFILIPLLIAQDKRAGTHEFTWSLPGPRSATAASTFTLFTAVSLPVALLSTVLAAWRFDVSLSVTWLVVPAGVLVALMGTSVGFGLAQAIPEPRIVNLITNIVVFLVMLFSPIAVPIERFPDWLATVHRVLPFYHMASLLRWTVSDGLVASPGTSTAVVIGWTVLAWIAAAWVLGRRR
ncbi:MAG TPA: ABC transporter permease [Acidimicrobiia bacterium]|nr:ABC transporter permease [Acidimicrobiia bacterium]